MSKPQDVFLQGNKCPNKPEKLLKWLKPADKRADDKRPRGDAFPESEKLRGFREDARK
jgi:hypothetical protein